MTHQGKRLRAFFDSQGIKYGSICERLGRHRNTVRRWFESESIEYEIMQELAKAWPDIMEEFPEVAWKTIPWQAKEPPLEYNLAPVERQCVQKLAELESRYLHLLEAYSMLQNKYIELISAR